MSVLRQAGPVQADVVAGVGGSWPPWRWRVPPMPRLRRSLSCPSSRGLLPPELPRGRMDAVGCSGEPEDRFLLLDPS